MSIKHYVIFYDIADSKRRALIVKYLEDYGYRIQYSVFEMTIQENYFNKLKENLLKIIAPKEDSLKIYELEEKSWKNRKSYGIGALIKEENYKIL